MQKKGKKGGREGEREEERNRGRKGGKKILKTTTNNFSRDWLYKIKSVLILITSSYFIIYRKRRSSVTV